MDYKETLDWMFLKLPMYQNIGASAYKKDLHNAVKLMEYLNNPHLSIKCIHVAGTNGKGSTSYMLASILQEAGYNVGLYTSPHLKDFRERIKVNGEMISEEYVCKFIEQNQNFLEINNLSFFEMTVGMAFQYFKDSNTDINIIEVGLGGRLDSTNVITPLISVITNIGMDHTQFLGDTLEKIAFEKAGIIKNNVPVVISQYVPETKTVFLNKAKECNADIYFASDLVNESLDSDLKGDYQIHNLKGVIQTIKLLINQFNFKISDSYIKSGLKKVVLNTGLMGRWQVLNEFPTVICDTAHNEDGLIITLNQLKNQKFDSLHIVLGVVNDKNLDKILPLFPKNAKYYFCCPNISRGLNVSILSNKAHEFGLIGDKFNSVSDAYQEALSRADDMDLIYVGGSTFVVAEIL